MNPQMGKYLIFFGLLIIIVGVLIYFFHDKLHWIGRLPGDIRIDKENVRIYFPITTMIVFSILLTILFRIFRKF